MLIYLHSLRLSLRSNSDRIKEQWRVLFDFELAQNSSLLEVTEPDIALEAVLVSSLPPSPSLPPSYLAVDPPLAIYYERKGTILLRLSDRAQIYLTLAQDSALANNGRAIGRILVTTQALDEGSLEDITTLALAPLLRRHGLFMIHAFAAADHKRAVMFVGASGSGKTSCGLALAASGWQLLANDVALMRQDRLPLCLLSPGTVFISPATFSRIPAFGHLFDKYAQDRGYQKVPVPRLEFLQEETIALSAPIEAIYFPTVGKGDIHHSEAVPRAVGLALLMESSMDQWDHDTWEDHIGFLEHLSQKVSFHSLQLGGDMASLPAFLEQSLVDVS